MKIPFKVNKLRILNQYNIAIILNLIHKSNKKVESSKDSERKAFTLDPIRLCNNLR